jgi:hypothetical protein
LRQENEVRQKQNEMRCVVSAANKPNSQPLNWLSHHINQDEDDATSAFRLFGWDMKQRLVAVATGKEGLVQEVVL